MIWLLILAAGGRLSIGFLSGELSNVAATADQAPEAALTYAIVGVIAVVAMVIKPALQVPIELAAVVFLAWDTWRVATALGVLS